jgi:hypothetical protein
MHSHIPHLLVLALVTGAHAASAQCGTGQANKATNCTFDTGFTPWSASFGTVGWNGSDGSNSGPGAATISCDDEFSLGALYQCLTDPSFSGLTGVTYGADFEEFAGSVTDCSVFITAWSDPGCSGSSTGFDGTGPVDPDNAAPFEQSGPLVAGVDFPAGTDSVEFVASCACPAESSGFYVDDVFLGVALVPVELQQLDAD